MKVNGKHYRSIWYDDEADVIRIIDQTKLPHEFVVADIRTLADAVVAISSMQVRGAPLIGATAAYGFAFAMRGDPSDSSLGDACETLIAARPTAVNLAWSLNEQRAAVGPLPPEKRAEAAFERATAIAEEDVEINRRIGQVGLSVLEEVASRKSGDPVNILTHCNAGWLATVDWGTATAPIYMAHDQGIPVHVWVDETRPRNQGASITAFELGQHGVPHTVISDNVGGHLMQKGMVDLCLVGTDRTTATGDVCNKIGTYLKALAAKDNQLPFYVALPGPSIDWSIDDGEEIPIEERSGEEISMLTGMTSTGSLETVKIVPPGSPVANYAFDITPANLVTALITERGITEPSKEGLAGLYPERIR
jgi:methylthioribose-1-phosphate isomerase